jgi:hypothetical protein
MKLTQLLPGKTFVTGNKSKDSNTSLKINKPREITHKEKKIEENEFDGQTQCN